MPKKKATKNHKAEIQVQKSPAEFFAENQAIAGFDNKGKSLYTTIRELVENSLDACESIGVLPAVSVRMVEYTQAEFNQLAGLSDQRQGRTDTELFEKKKAKKKTHGKKKGEIKTETPSMSDAAVPANDEPTDNKDDNKVPKKQRQKAPQDAYFRITVQDNGCGMQHDAIPNLFGRVLSGSKYGVRQTRGKFGLGAKMALIWAKKSSGQPIRIVSAHRLAADAPAPSHYSECVLDIDIYKNAPKIIRHEYLPNDDCVQGTTVEVLIAGNWTTYKSRIVQYLQQLAVITPYAVLELFYENASDTAGKRNLHMRYDRRSEQMPPPAQTVKHHPSSVNNLVIQQLVQYSKHQKNYDKLTLVKFLSTELSAVSPALAKRLIAELAASAPTSGSANSSTITESMHPAKLTDAQITRLVQLLRQVQLFKSPDGSCLSPLGEYNLNLGIRKVLNPDLIATARDKPGAYEGHPFVVEAAVSLGGSSSNNNNNNSLLKEEGITVIRFANRIPLLLEGGADVSTRVAQSKIRWANYKIDHKRDRIGVFVSIVSTKVPFKGTSKEYIGDDCTAIQQSVKRALQSCCQQLRVHLIKRNAWKDAQERKSRLQKYIPDVSRSIFGLLDGMRKRRASERQPPSVGTPTYSPTKRLRLDRSVATDMIRRLDRKEVTEASIQEILQETVDEQQAAALPTQGGAESSEERVPLYLVPLYNFSDAQYDIVRPLFRFRPIQPVHVVSNAASNDSN